MKIGAYWKLLALLGFLTSSAALAQGDSATQTPAAAAVAGPAPAPYLARLAAARIPTEAAAVVVRPLDGGKLDWSANPRKPMNPASTMKLVTTYSALNLLGPAFTFRTEVLSEAPLIGEALRGDLYLRGGGDPKLVIEDLWGDYDGSALKASSPRMIASCRRA